ncbi:RIP metalloprotease RseP [Longimonas halophila]|uniref:Zinc metalloprotease n=1 Tax=Longimonas halophila TaxID=1469170 RepID=A0A2H3NX75_9BACT|nr:RIP metalloprotease RseP [Longimonas halophila]PEN06727.1 RIP metalloprotease RseP [Longimonas halophila]
MELLLSIVTSTAWVLLALTILVFIHELGHFLTAKYFGMRVERFSIGFPPTVFGRRMGETEYVVGATPLGGYVKISGMIDENLDTEHIEAEPEPHEFRSKPVWQRIIVITAGVIFNVFLAALIFAGIKWSTGESYIPAENIESIYVEESSVAYNMGLRTGDEIAAVNGNAFETFDQLNPGALLADTLTVTVARNGETETLVGPRDIMTQMSRASQTVGSPLGISFTPPLVGAAPEGRPAAEAGLRTGDRVVHVAGDSIRFWQEMAERLQETGGAPTPIRWLRADSLQCEGDPEPMARTAQGALYEATITPEQGDDGRYLIGVAAPPTEMLAAEFGQRTRTFSPGEALVAGTAETWSYAENIVVSLKRIVVGRDSVRDNLGGPVRIAQVTSQAASAGAVNFWRIVAILSITLAIMNILPIPALDGGQLVFLLYEGITRRPPSTRVRLIAQQVGMLLLLGFMIFLIFNDILRL